EFRRVLFRSTELFLRRFVGKCRQGRHPGQAQGQGGMETPRLLRGQQVVRRVQEYAGASTLLDPGGHLVDPGFQVGLVGIQVGSADEAYLKPWIDKVATWIEE